MRLHRILACTLGFVTLSQAVSFSIDPWIMVLEPHKNILSQVITLKYVGDEARDPKAPAPLQQGTTPIPVELSLMARQVNEKGEVVYPDKKPVSDLALFPSQLILYPGDVQRVQLQWVAEKIPGKEITFGLIAAQVPVAIDDGGKKYTKAVGMVNILTRYETIVVVRPPGVKPRVKVDSAYASRDSAGTNRLVVLLSNQGTGMQSAKEMKLQITPLASNGKADFSKRFLYSPELPRLAVKHAIFAGGKRRLELPWPDRVPIGPIQVVPEFP